VCLIRKSKIRFVVLTVVGGDHTPALSRDRTGNTHTVRFNGYTETFAHIVTIWDGERAEI
jgi:hypothetical protein